ncbi:MAG: TetR/AcrR family transcriptional regulator [Deinococcota bacterium]
MDNTPQPSASYHHGDLYNALIEAGITLLQEEGVSALTLRKVAGRAKVSHAAPYRHFADKHALLAAIAQQGFQTLTATMQDAVNKHGGSPRQQLLAIGEHYVQFGITHPAHLNLMFGEVLQQENDTLHEVARASFNVLLNAVTHAQQAGILKAGNSRQMAVSMWSMVHGLTVLKGLRLAEQGDSELKEYVGGMLEQLLEGLATSN